MAKLNPKEAAEVIRPMLETSHVPLTPEQRYAAAFYDAVCRELNLESNHNNVAHVSSLLDKAGVEVPTGDSYPRMLTTHDTRNRVVAQVWPDNHPTRAGQEVVLSSKEEEDFYHTSNGRGIDQHDMDAWAAAEQTTATA